MSTARAFHRCCAAWIGVMALLVQAWLPLVHHPVTLFAPDGEETAGFAALAGEHSALCTAAAGPRDGKAPPAKQAPHRQPVCPVCRVLHAASGITPRATVVDAPQTVAFHTYRPFPREVAATPRFRPVAQPRAPPRTV